MVECRHCGDEFDDDAAYAAHLDDAHGDDRSRIDDRRVAAHRENDSDDTDWVPVAVLLLLAAILAVVAVRAFAGGTGPATTQPTDLGAVHYHGTIQVAVDGDELDFSRDAYQRQADAFHFEGGDGDNWHVHARDVTLAYAMQTLGIDVTADAVTIDDTTYRDADDDTTVTVAVDGDPVDPTEYVLRDRDHVTVTVETDG